MGYRGKQAKLVIVFALLLMFFASIGALAPPGARAEEPPPNPASNSMSVSITNSLADIKLIAAQDAGDWGVTNSTINVHTDTDGYLLYLEDGDDNTDLAHGGTSSAPNITSIGEDASLSIDDFPANTWDYSLDSTTFTGVPKKSKNSPHLIRSCRGLTRYDPNDDCRSVYAGNTTEKTQLYFGVKIDGNLLAGVYRDSLVVSVVPVVIPPDVPEVVASNYDWDKEVTLTASVPTAGHRYRIDHYDYYLTTSPTDVPEYDSDPTGATTDGTLVLDKNNISEDGTYYIYFRTVDSAGMASE